MGRRILAVLAALLALLALLWAAVPAYAASPAVDSAYLTRELGRMCRLQNSGRMVRWAITKSMPTRTIIVCILR